jgi:hypothetical protein
MSELVDGGGIDGGTGTYFANCGDDVHAVGTLDPVIPGYRRLHRDQAGRQAASRSRGVRPVGVARAPRGMGLDRHARVARGAASRYVVSDKLIWEAPAPILRRERVLGDLFREILAGQCDEFLLRRASREEER